MNNEIILKKDEEQKTELIMLPIALMFAVLFDRLMVSQLNKHLPFFSAVFMSCVLVFYIYVYRKKIFKSLFAVCASAILAALCCWNFIFDYNSHFGVINFFAIPISGMVLVQFICGEYELKEAGKIFIAWISAFTIKPFISIPRFFAVLDFTILSKRNNNFKKLITGLFISVLMLIIIIPLLSGADMVFNYYISKILGEFELPSLGFHLILIFAVCAIFYSFIWNMYYYKKANAPEEYLDLPQNLDTFITTVVLTTLSIAYTLFCIIQFNHLFAKTGLPGSFTYSEYARQGFNQLVMVAGINLFLFAIVTRYGKADKILLYFRALFLIFTAIMLISGFVRLKLYIDSYGLTWLRLLPAWFIVYLAAIIILSFIRLINEKLPLMACSAILLLFWFCVLGYSNPDALIVKYNSSNADPKEWAAENNIMFRGELSNDAIIALSDMGIDKSYLSYLMFNPDTMPYYQNENIFGYSWSYHKLSEILK